MAMSDSMTSAMTIDGKKLGARIKEEAADQVRALKTKGVKVSLDAIMEEQASRTRDRAKQFADDNFGDGFDVSVEVAFGTPHVEIVRLADEHDADLIVMATHGRGFISHAILGSTTERVLRRANCPVFVVRELRTY